MEFYLSRRHVITDHISWVIGNGNKAKFWEDSWNANKSIQDYGDEELKKFLCERWGSNVRNYMIEADRVLGKTWQWKDWRAEGLSER